jgi:hypothetical protein
MSAYQLDLILDGLDHLETEHLHSKGRIAGVPCDCFSKARRSLRRHARETIPIAARQAWETKVYWAVASWAERIVKG